MVNLVRYDIINNVQDVFFQHIKKAIKNKQKTPSCLSVFGVNFFYIYRNDLYFMCSSRDNISPTIPINFLEKLYNIIFDFLGRITEDLVRININIINEVRESAGVVVTIL